MTETTIVRDHSSLRPEGGGDPKFLSWYPMRVTYGRQQVVKDYLDSIQVENFLPMHYELQPRPKGKPRRVLVPAISNLIFIRSRQAELSFLKQTRRELLPLRYMISRPHEGGSGTIIIVPDGQMENFMRVASVTDDRVLFSDASTFVGKEGMRVLVTGGDFEGVTGVIRRVKGMKRVVVEIQGVAMVAIAFVPSAYLQPLPDTPSEQE